MDSLHAPRAHECTVFGAALYLAELARCGVVESRFDSERGSNFGFAKLGMSVPV
jgi:hypothetical protein